MIYPQDIMDALAALIRDKFPGEEVYMDRVPVDFKRPSTLVELGQPWKTDIHMGTQAIELRPVITMTTFVVVDEYHHSHLRELNRRQMVLTGLLLPGYIRVQDRAPKVVGLELEGGWDFAAAKATFSYTLSRADFETIPQAPVMEDLHTRMEATTYG
nr:hypothetical protein [uncultured Dysosmobacter sp.]